MLNRLWLLFAQATTLVLAGIFVISTLKPQWLEDLGSFSGAMQGDHRIALPDGQTQEASLLQSQAPPPASSLREAAARAMPAVVYVFTTQRSRQSAQHPFLNDPTLRRFFGDQFPPPRGDGGRESAGLGSGVIVSPQGYVLKIGRAHV